MIASSTCNLASLAPYTPSSQNPWNVEKINHLYRRLCFGASKTQILAALNQGNPSALIDKLIDDAVALNPSPLPEWGKWNKDDFNAAEAADPTKKFAYYVNQGRYQMLDDFKANTARDRLVLFWSNHFVTEENVYKSPAYQAQYYSLLQLHALGNFRDFVYDIGISNPMLVYLNGDENTKDRPNENYGRELYELFTLGVDNGYTEDDIQNTAKALTGYVNTNGIKLGDILFDPSKFSNETKTIFGQTGNWGYDDVINILFEQRNNQVAQYICQKLYTYFVSPSPSATIISEMAKTFISSNYNIATVLKQLFKSEHFFNIASIGAIIKSPIDLNVSFYNELTLTTKSGFNVNKYLKNILNVLGQSIFNPVDVKGWQGDEDWISPDLLIGRWDGLRHIINMGWKGSEDQFKDFLIGLPIGNQNDDVLKSDTKDVTLVVRTILNYFFPRGVNDPVIFEEAIGIFKIDGIPENYYEDGTWSLSYPLVSHQFVLLLSYMAEIPEFQLK